MEGQQKLKAAKVLCVGTGGLGAPLALYLAAAGVGTLGLVDFDTVDASNLQRQIIHSTGDRRHAEGRLGGDQAEGAEPAPERRQAQHHADQRQCARDLQGLRHHRGRHGQLPDALPGERRLRADGTSRMRMARSSASRVRRASLPPRKALAIAACIRSRHRRAWCRRAPRAACWASCRDWWA